MGLIWGFAESTVFFIVPDVAVAFLSAMAPKDWWKAAVASVAGTLLGAIVLFAVVHLWLHGHARQLLLVIPAIHSSTLATADRRIAAAGPAALLPAAFLGIPYKIYAAELTLSGTGLPILLAWTVPSRLLRLIPVAGGAALLGKALQTVIDRYFLVFVAAYVLGWATFYSWYWTR